MKLIDLIKMGLKNLLRRKARSLLTVIGVIIGTLSIVIMVSIGIGMNQSFEQSVMENGGMTMIEVEASSYYEDENGNWKNEKQILNDEVIEKLAGIEHIKKVSPIINNWDMQLVSGKFSTYSNFIIMDMDCYEDFGYPALEDGSYPNKETAKNTVYLGSETLNNFYTFIGNRYETKTIDPSKDKLEITFPGLDRNPRKKEYKYACTNAVAIPTGEQYSEASYSAFIDIDTYKEIIKKCANTLKIDARKKLLASLDSYDRIYVNVDNMNNVTAVQKELESIGYKSYSNMQYIEPMQETANMLELVLGAIGAVAMLVSAINIANTMIMSIYERTREIGIMKVLGCKVADIRKLFLFEAGMIGLIGGIFGIGLSYLASWLVNKYGSDLFESLMSSSVGVSEGASFSVIPLWLPFAAAVFAMGIGIISGFFPALKATKISAIEAMKANE